MRPVESSDNTIEQYQIGDNLDAFALIMAKEGKVTTIEEILGYIQDNPRSKRGNFTPEYVAQLRSKIENHPDFREDFEIVEGGYKFVSGNTAGRINMIRAAKEYLEKNSFKSASGDKVTEYMQDSYKNRIDKTLRPAENPPEQGQLSQQEHTKRAKQRALQLVKEGNLKQAIDSMVNDLAKDKTRPPEQIQMIGMMGLAIRNDSALDEKMVTEFIEGFAD